MPFLDITATIDDRLPVWPGDDRPAITTDVDEELGIHSSSICTTLHLGTHIDAPAHGIPSGTTVDQIPLEVLIGPAEVRQIPEDVLEIGPEELDALNLPTDCKRLLLKTGNEVLWDRGPEFSKAYAALTVEGAVWVRDRGIQLVGIDYLSIQGYNEPGFDTHNTLLSAGIVILEGLRLETIQPGQYELICLPMKIAGVDGAPARVILRNIE